MNHPQRSTARESGGCVFRAAPVAPGWLLAALCCTWMCGAVLAAPLPEKVPEHTFVRVDLEENQQAFILLVKDNRFHPVEIIETKSGLAFTGPPGHYAVLITGGGNSLPQYVEIAAKTPPVPPKPDDPPKPPVDPPRPDIGTAPLPDVPGFKVLMVYESSDLPPRITKAHHDIKVDPGVRGWLTQATTPEVDKDGKQWAGWRIGDPDQGVPETSDVWERMLKLPRTQVPWLVVNNGDRKVGYSGPMPENGEKVIALLEGLK